MSSDLINSNMSQDMRKLLNIMEQNVGDPVFVTVNKLVQNGLLDDWDYFFRQPESLKNDSDGVLIIKPGQKVKIRWPYGNNKSDERILEVVPIRFECAVSDSTPTKLLMDIVPLIGTPSKIGQGNIFDPENKPDSVDSVQPKPKPSPSGEMKQGELFPETATSDYSFLRTPLWEESTRIASRLMGSGDLPNWSWVLNPNQPNPISDQSQKNVIYVSRNVTGQSMDLARKAFILQTIVEQMGGPTMLINNTGSDQEVLRSIARKNNIEYRDA